jgi:hypothetical protein
MDKVTSLLNHRRNIRKGRRKGKVGGREDGERRNAER